jgi:RecA/RadA recombinase
MVKSDLKAVSDLIGDYSDEAIHAVYGASQVGKTTWLLQELYSFSHKTGKGTIYYDAEGGGRKFIEAWDPILKKKFPKAKTPTVVLQRNWINILLDHGKKVNLKTSDTGKADVLILEDKPETPLDKIIRKDDVGMIVYDSITMPMKYFGSARQNFPARSVAQSLWLQSMIDIIDKHGCIIFTTHHSSKDPALPYAKEQMSGGAAVQYFSKVIFYLKKWNAKGADTYRTIKLARYFDKPPNEFEGLMKLTNDGYVDATEKDMDADKKEARKK